MPLASLAPLRLRVSERIAVLEMWCWVPTMVLTPAPRRSPDEATDPTRWVSELAWAPFSAPGKRAWPGRPQGRRRRPPPSARAALAAALAGMRTVLGNHRRRIWASVVIPFGQLWEWPRSGINRAATIYLPRRPDARICGPYSAVQRPSPVFSAGGRHSYVAKRGRVTRALCACPGPASVLTCGNG